MMKPIFMILLLASVKLHAFNASTTPFGLGLNIGQPMGVSGKYWLDKFAAIDFTLGFTLGSASAIHLHSDYLYHLYDPLQVKSGTLPLYFGAGLRVKFSDSDSTKLKNRKTRLGIRAPLGVEYMFEDFDMFPFNPFAEIAPVIDLVPKVYFDMNFGIGARYYF